MTALTDFRPQAFAACLQALRDDAHLTQRGLSRLADVSHSAISTLEKAEAPPPHPTMLARLARGLATSGSGRVDERRADALYFELMRAAGYMPPAADAPSPDQQFREQLIARLGDDGPRMELMIRKLAGRSPATRQAAIRVGEILLDNDAGR